MKDDVTAVDKNERKGKKGSIAESNQQIDR
jgi:hypothetical protein